MATLSTNLKGLCCSLSNPVPCDTPADNSTILHPGGESIVDDQQVLVSIPIARDSLSFESRQAFQLKEMTRRAHIERKRRRRIWQREMDALRAQFLSLYPLIEGEDGTQVADLTGDTKRDEDVLMRKGSTDVLNKTAVDKLICCDSPSGEKRLRLRFDVSPFDRESIRVVSNGARVCVRATRRYKAINGTGDLEGNPDIGLGSKPSNSDIKFTDGSNDRPSGKEANVRADDKHKIVGARFEHRKFESVAHCAPPTDSHSNNSQNGKTSTYSSELKAIDGHENPDKKPTQEYVRNIQLPKDIDEAKLVSFLTTDGILIIEGPIVTLSSIALLSLTSAWKKSDAADPQSTGRQLQSPGVDGSPAGSSSSGGSSSTSKEKIGVAKFRDEDDGHRRLHLIVDLGAGLFEAKDIHVQFIKADKIQVKAKRKDEDDLRKSKSKFCKEYELSEKIEKYSLNGHLQSDGRLIVAALAKPKKTKGDKKETTTTTKEMNGSPGKENTAHTDVESEAKQMC